MVKKKSADHLPKLTEAEQDLLSHIEDGYQLETDSLAGAGGSYKTDFRARLLCIDYLALGVCSAA